MNIQTLQDCLVDATEGGAAWGANMPKSREVIIRVGNDCYPIDFVACTFFDGRFAMVIDCGTEKL